MKIAIGSLNPTKRLAVIMACKTYPRFADAMFMASDVPSGVPAQPRDIDTMLLGARNRADGARNAMHADYGIGIESGLFPSAHIDSGWFDVTSCVITDGQDVCVGLSPAFEVPPDIMRIMDARAVDLSEAARLAGYTDHPKIGTDIGILGLMTGGRVTRQSYTEQAVHFALIRLIQAWKRP